MREKWSCVAPPASTGAGEDGLTEVTDGSQACAGDQEMSCWTGDFAWLTRQTMVDGTVMRFEQALPLFLSGKEMISGARMKFLPYLRECCGIGTCSRKKEGRRGLLVGAAEEMERFLGFVKQIRRSRRRKGKKYRPEEDYHEGYEDVYYYASEHFRKLDSRGVSNFFQLLTQSTSQEIRAVEMCLFITHRGAGSPYRGTTSNTIAPQRSFCPLLPHAACIAVLVR
ncbi:hypothetical protein Anapl_07432 [Anas platyrhynchos]|uniref:Uncharacterized protein n=1 Tax=Anas platyrhynchos TaxID=8839 RepID=R0L7E4_ANAPL|nr:hypothetical protein Anapl_07432 [Anas platyrhynchos]